MHVLPNEHRDIFSLQSGSMSDIIYDNKLSTNVVKQEQLIVRCRRVSQINKMLVLVVQFLREIVCVRLDSFFFPPMCVNNKI